MFKKLMPVSFMLLSVTLTFAQNKSVYTYLSDNKCNVANDSQIPGNMNGECAGVGGYKLMIYADDERMSVNVVSPGQKVTDTLYC